MRKKYVPARLQDFVIDAVRSPPFHSSSSVSSPASGISYPLAHCVSYDYFSQPHREFLAAITAGVEPTSYRQASRDPGWRDAMQSEIRALEDNGTWELVDLPTGKKALGSRWIYKIKYHSDGRLERVKAHLVVFGNHQVVGLDYSETFAPVAKMSTV